MTYKLLIQPKITYDKFHDLLTNKEFPRGELLNIEYYAFNIGDEDFIGGILEEVSAEYSQSLLQFRYPNIKVESIPKNTKKLIFSWEFTPTSQGLVWLQCKIKADDQKPIQYFQIPEKSGGVPIEGDKWKNYYMAVDRQQLEMIVLLKEMDKKLGYLVERD